VTREVSLSVYHVIGGLDTGGITTLGQEGEVLPQSAALPHFRTSCRAPLHRASEPLCAALL